MNVLQKFHPAPAPLPPPVGFSLDSEEIASLVREAAAAFAAPMRPLTPEEIGLLQGAANFCANWSRVLVGDGFDPSRITGCRFEGEVRIGGPVGGPAASAPDAAVAPIVLHNSTLRDCAVGPGAVVDTCASVSYCSIGARAVLRNVNLVDMSLETTIFGNDLELFAQELYNRRLPAVSGMDLAPAAWFTSPDALAPDLLPLCDAFLAEVGRFRTAVRSGQVIIGPGAQIRGAAAITDSWIGPDVLIEAAGSIRSSTLRGTPDAPTRVRDGANLNRALVSPGCVIEDHASVRDSLLSCDVHVGTQAVVRGCFVGEGSRLRACEAGESLLGPATTALHHGLILAAWWPEGRGNISYGSNVGSNHTGRAPDQEIWPGEGAFFGLGCNVRFPASFREAPYVMIASGLDILPQRVLFSFSLINARAADYELLSPSIHEIFPGWALRNNAYGLERRERNLVVRSDFGAQASIFRPDIIEKIRADEERLRSGQSRYRSVYVEEDLPGLGKNFMTEESRRAGLAAYEFGARFGAARALLRTLMGLDREDPGARAEAARVIVWAADQLGEDVPDELVDAAIAMESEWKNTAEANKARDLERGVAILPDYERRHISGEEDPLLRSMSERLRHIEDRREHYIAILEDISRG